MKDVEHAHLRLSIILMEKEAFILKLTGFYTVFLAKRICASDNCILQNGSADYVHV
jgi:hypothetical protein